MLSNKMKTECCGVGLLTIEKSDMVHQIAKLEKENQGLKDRIDNAIANREINREEFAKKCFNAGLDVANQRVYNPTVAWLNFKATEL